MSGGMGLTPLDATDSLVIPLGWAMAAWIWRRPVLSREALRLRWGLLVAGVAVLASVATSYPEPVGGIRSVGVSESGAICASSNVIAICSFRSDNGGLTWTGSSVGQESIAWGQHFAETPSGRFTIRGTEIVYEDASGSTRTVYSAGYLKKEGNAWVQQQATRHLDERRLSTSLGPMVYDEKSDNVVVSLGILGVVVGSPDGNWTPYAVGPYAPVDFSFFSKARMLLSNPEFWAAAIGLSMFMTMWGLSLAQRSLGQSLVLLEGKLAGFTGIIVTLFVLMVGTGEELQALTVVLVWPIIFAILIWASVAGIRKSISVGSHRGSSEDMSVRGLLLIFFSFLASVELQVMFGYESPPDQFIPSGLAAFSLLSFIVIGASLLTPWRLLRHWPAVLFFLPGNLLLVFLVYFLWLETNFLIWVPGIVAVVLTGLAALVLAAHTSAKMRARGITCPDCGEWNRVAARSCTNCRQAISY